MTEEEWATHTGSPRDKRLKAQHHGISSNKLQGLQLQIITFPYCLSLFSNILLHIIWVIKKRHKSLEVLQSKMSNSTTTKPQIYKSDIVLHEVLRVACWVIASGKTLLGHWQAGQPLPGWALSS